MKTTCLVACVALAPAAWAAVEPDMDCQKKTASTERLACYEKAYADVVACTEAAADKRLVCYDQTVGRVIPEGGKVPPMPGVGWQVREKITVDTVGDIAVEDGGASIKLGRSDGQGFSATQVAALYRGKAFNSRGWSPFYGVAWSRDTSVPAERSDARQLSAGVTGALGGAGKGGWDLYPTLLATARHKLYTDTDEATFTANGDVFVPALNFSDKTLAYELVPVLGLHVASLRDHVDATADGATTGAYAGGRFRYEPRGSFPSITVSGKLVAYADLKTPDDAARRRTQYGKLSVSHRLVDPKTKTGWVPAIQLSLERGRDLVAGADPARKVTLSFTARFD